MDPSLQSETTLASESEVHVYMEHGSEVTFHQEEKVQTFVYVYSNLIPVLSPSGGDRVCSLEKKCHTEDEEC